jgi:hypothetical protein
MAECVVKFFCSTSVIPEWFLFRFPLSTEAFVIALVSAVENTAQTAAKMEIYFQAHFKWPSTDREKEHVLSVYSSRQK